MSFDYKRRHSAMPRLLYRINSSENWSKLSWKMRIFILQLSSEVLCYILATPSRPDSLHAVYKRPLISKNLCISEPITAAPEPSPTIIGTLPSHHGHHVTSCINAVFRHYYVWRFWGCWRQTAEAQQCQRLCRPHPQSYPGAATLLVSLSLLLASTMWLCFICK